MMSPCFGLCNYNIYMLCYDLARWNCCHTNVQFIQDCQVSVSTLIYHISLNKRRLQINSGFIYTQGVNCTASIDNMPALDHTLGAGCWRGHCLDLLCKSIKLHQPTPTVYICGCNVEFVYKHRPLPQPSY